MNLWKKWDKYNWTDLILDYQDSNSIVKSDRSNKLLNRLKFDCFIVKHSNSLKIYSFFKMIISFIYLGHNVLEPWGRRGVEIYRQFLVVLRLSLNANVLQ